jgi:LPXTG-motif cell wall-anchored protein
LSNQPASGAAVAPIALFLLGAAISIGGGFFWGRRQRAAIVDPPDRNLPNVCP